MAAALSSVHALVSARVAPVLAARWTTVAAALGQKQTVARGGAWLHTLQATPYKVTLIMPAEVKVEMDVPANVSIVEHAKEVGVSLPASCHAGTCPRCAGKVVSGTVNQKKQKFLNPDQIAEGFVLTCVAYPTSDVVIKTHKEMDIA